MDIFVIYVGGKTKRSLVEVHDIRFAVGEKIEECYEQLRKQWWGTSKSLHIDAWGVLKHANGYNIYLKDTPVKNQGVKLYFINLGGYDSKKFTELHENVFIVASGEDEAKQKAKEQIKHWELPHKDYLYEVEECINIEKLLKSRRLYIHLEKTQISLPFEFICKYVQIGK